MVNSKIGSEYATVIGNEERNYLVTFPAERFPKSRNTPIYPLHGHEALLSSNNTT